MPEQARNKYQEWKAMILRGHLPYHAATALVQAEIALGKEASVSPHLVVYRDVLIVLAQNEGAEPRFLFPHRRGE